MVNLKRVLLACLVLLTASLACIPVMSNYSPTQVVEDGALFWYCLSPAEYYEGIYNRAYFAYYNTDYEVNVQYFDEGSGTLSNPSTVWSNWGYNSYDTLGDHHGSPTLTILKYQTGGNAIHNGKILIAAADHASPLEGKGRLETRRSVYPEFNNGGSEDISFEDAVQVRSTRATYSALIELSDGTIFLFSRLSNQAGGDNSACTTYAWTSDDAGSSWTPYNNGNPLWDASQGDNTPYMFHVSPNNDNTGIHCMISCCTYTPFVRYLDIFYLFYNNSDGKWYKADGSTKFTLGNSHTFMDLVYATDDTEDEEDWTWGWYIQDDGNGNPYLIFINEVDRSSGTGVNGDILRANYSSGSWNVETVLTEGTGYGSNYPHGACLDPTDVDIVYVTLPLGSPGSPTTTRTQLQRYEKGSSWTKTEDITVTSAGSYLWPVAVRNAKANNEFKILYMYSEYYTSFNPGCWELSLYAYPYEPFTNVVLNTTIPFSIDGKSYLLQITILEE